jgi:hypothetical protein
MCSQCVSYAIAAVACCDNHSCNTVITHVPLEIQVVQSGKSSSSPMTATYRLLATALATICRSPAQLRRSVIIADKEREA